MLFGSFRMLSAGLIKRIRTHSDWPDTDAHSLVTSLQATARWVEQMKSRADAELLNGANSVMEEAGD